MQGNLSFKRKTVDGCMTLLTTELQTRWGLKDGDVKEWQTIIANRLRNMLHVVNKDPSICVVTHASSSLNCAEVMVCSCSCTCLVRQEMSKNKPAAWVAKLPWNSDAVPIEASSSTQEFSYDWSPEAGLAFRCAGNSGKKEFSCPINLEQQGKGSDFIVATFADGTSHEVADITVDTFKRLHGGSGRKHEPPLWEGEHSTSHNKLCLVQRADRNLILILLEQTRHILQIRVDRFGELPPPQPASVPRDTPALQSALKAMVDIAEKYRCAEIEVTDLYRLRDDALAQLKNDGASRKRILKKNNIRFNWWAGASFFWSWHGHKHS